jgi:hypothetical protein
MDGTLMAGGIGMQLGMNYDKVQVGLYLQGLFGIQLVEYLLFAVLPCGTRSGESKIYRLPGDTFSFQFHGLPFHIQVEHNLLIFGADPGWGYTDMRGFGPTLGPWLWFKLYWIAWALLLAVIARLLLARGREQSLRTRVQLARRRFTRSTKWVAIIASGLDTFSLGSFIFYNTNVLNEYQTSSDIQERKAEYERRYGRYRNTPQPTLTATKLHVEIYPERQRVEIRAGYTLVNKHTVAIDSIHLGSTSGISPTEVAFNRAAAAVRKDKELGHHIYVLKQALQPGDSLQLNFIVRYQEQGFSNSGTNALVVKNGTYFTKYDLLPAIGYQRSRELDDAVVRKKHQLAARPSIPSLYDNEARKRPAITDQNTFEAIIGTANDEVAVAPGTLHKTWTKGNRRYFHYKTDAPIGGEYSILSGNYAVQESKWNDVAIRVYYHPGHAQNIDRMLRSVKASLAYFTEQFGPYPSGYITLVERAGSGSGATADAGIIYYGEQYPLMNPDGGPDGFDLPYYILAHEVAHQWWGMARLTPA